MIAEIVEWSRAFFMPYGIYGLALISFMESAFFPVPPDIILIPLVLMDPSNAMLYAAVCTIASTAGSLLGYWIGKTGGRRIVRRFVGKKDAAAVKGYFDKYGPWTLVISGLTPIPYKVFTITAGTFGYKNKVSFLAACTLGRGIRFFLEAAILVFLGEQLSAAIMGNFELVAIAVVIALVGMYLVYTRLIRRP